VINNTEFVADCPHVQHLLPTNTPTLLTGIVNKRKSPVSSKQTSQRPLILSHMLNGSIGSY